MTTEHQMIALASGTPFEHQQSQFLPLGKDTLPDGFHLSLGDMVHIHSYGSAHPLTALQRSILVGQTRVVHLQKLVLHTGKAVTHLLEDSFLHLRVTQLHIFGSRGDGAHMLRPVLHIDNVYTHTLSIISKSDK